MDGLGPGVEHNTVGKQLLAECYDIFFPSVPFIKTPCIRNLSKVVSVFMLFLSMKIMCFSNVLYSQTL